MATIHRYPVFLWRTPQGKVAVRLLEDFYPFGSAVAENEREAMGMLKDYLSASARRGAAYYVEPDFLEPEIRKVKLSVIPEYRAGHRTYPCKELLRFALPCVLGKRKEGSRTAALPTLDLSFDYHAGDDFERIARHYVGHRLSGMTPQQLSRFLPPAETWLAELSVTMREKPAAYDDGEELEALQAIAEPIGARDWRRVSKTWERESEVRALVELLSDENRSVCLVGEPGCGKTSVLVESARAIERYRRGEGGAAVRIFWMTGGARLVSGMRYLGQWEERLEAAIASLSTIPGVLCVENLLDLLRVGGGSPDSSIAAFLAPYLEDGTLRMVAEATPEELDACDRLLPGFADRFHALRLEPFSPEGERRLLHRAATYFTQSEGVDFPESAAERAGELFARFEPYAAMPGKVFDFMARLADRCADDSLPVSPAAAEGLFADLTGLPPELIAEDAGAFEVGKVSAFLEAKLVGQDAAVGCVARSVAKFGTGLNDPVRPIGVFLFCGPTGVGKTQMVRRLGDLIFPNRPERERLLRLDMSEYAGPDAPMRLLGDVGGAPSELVRHIRANPFSIVLLDEIEKADPAVFDVLLGMFDEGRLTDTFGRATSFRSSWIIMTSNLGAGAASAIGFGDDGGSALAHSGFDASAASKFFRPEFFNRIDQTVVFDPLDRAGIEEVTRRELRDVERREGLTERGLKLCYGDDLVRGVARLGFDPAYGARPLQRAVESAVVAPLARYLVSTPELRDAEIVLEWDAAEQAASVH